MRITNPKHITHPDDEIVAAAMAAARSLGRALGESSAFKQFEAAYDVFQSDEAAQR